MHIKTNTALIILDFVNDIIHPQGKIAASASYVEDQQVVQRANHVIAWAREKQYPIIFVKVGFSANYYECPLYSPIFGAIKEKQALQLHTWGTDFYQGLDVRETDTVIIKHRVNAFYGTSLEILLRNHSVENLILCGIATDMVVQSTARDAHDRDYRVIVVADACGARTQAVHRAALEQLARVAEINQASDFK